MAWGKKEKKWRKVWKCSLSEAGKMDEWDFRVETQATQALNYIWCVLWIRAGGRKTTHKEEKKNPQKTSIFLSFCCHFLVGSPSGPAELLALTITVQCFAPLSYFTDNYRPQNRPNRSIPPSRPPSAGCQQSEIVLIYTRRPSSCSSPHMAGVWPPADY